MRPSTLFLPAAVLAMILAGCKPAEAPSAAPAATEPAQSPATTAAEPLPADTTEPAPTTVATLTVDPAQMRTCDKNAPVTLKWDATAMPGVKGIEIWMANANKEPKLFGKGPAKGEKQTGAWVRAGAQFILKNQADGAEIAHAEVTGQRCL